MIDRRTLLITGLAACVPGVAAAGAPAQDLPRPQAPSLNELRSLALTRQGGTRTTLGANLAPAPTLVSFWASWCAPCLNEARYLVRLRARTPAEQLNIIGINVDREPREEIEITRFLRQVNANYTQLRGDRASFRAFDPTPAPMRIPRLFIFGVDGAREAMFSGFDPATGGEEIDVVVQRLMGASA